MVRCRSSLTKNFLDLFQRIYLLMGVICLLFSHRSISSLSPSRTLLLNLSLDLSGCDLTDRGVAYLSGLQRLRALSVAGIGSLTDEAARAIASLTALRALDIAGTRYVNECSSPVSSLSKSFPS